MSDSGLGGSEIQHFFSCLRGDLPLYVVYVWGGRGVPHFDSRPVSIYDRRVGMTPPFRSGAGR